MASATGLRKGYKVGVVDYKAREKKIAFKRMYYSLLEKDLIGDTNLSWNDNCIKYVTGPFSETIIAEFIIHEAFYRGFLNWNTLNLALDKIDRAYIGSWMFDEGIQSG